MPNLAVKLQIRAEDRASGALAGVARASGKLESRLEAARKSLANLDRRDRALRKFRELKGGLANAGAEADRARARTAKLGRELAKAENPTKKLRQEFEASRRKTRALGDAHRRQRETLHSLRRELQGTGIDTRRLSAVQRATSADIESANGAVSRFERAQAGVDRAAGSLGTGRP